MLNRPYQWALGLGLITSLLVSCKPVAEEGSELQGVGFNPGKAQASTAVDTATALPVSNVAKPIVFNLANVIRTKVPSYADYVTPSDKVLFLSSDLDIKAAKRRNIARSIKVTNKTAGLKTEKFRAETNFLVTTNVTKSAITATWHLDAFVLERLISATPASHSAEISLKAGLNSKFQAFANMTIKTFGAANFTKNATTAAPSLASPSKAFTLLKATPPVFGIPKLGVRAGVTFKGEVGLTGEVDFSTPKAVSISFTPDVAFGVTLTAAKVEAAFASAEVGGAVTIINAYFPATMSLGGRIQGIQSNYASFAFKTPKIDLVKGNLYFAANLKVPSPTGVIPAAVEKLFWIWLGDKVAAKKTRIKVPAKWKFVAVLWEPKNALMSIDIKGDQGSSVVTPKACAGDLTAHAAGVKKDVATDKGIDKSVSQATVVNLEAMAKKAKGTGCAGKK